MHLNGNDRGEYCKNMYITILNITAIWKMFCCNILHIIWLNHTLNQPYMVLTKRFTATFIFFVYDYMSRQTTIQTRSINRIYQLAAYEPVNPSQFQSHIYDPNYVTVPTDGLAPDTSRPTAGNAHYKATCISHEVSVGLWIIFWWSDDIIQYGWPISATADTTEYA